MDITVSVSVTDDNKVARSHNPRQAAIDLGINGYDVLNQIAADTAVKPDPEPSTESTEWPAWHKRHCAACIKRQQKATTALAPVTKIIPVRAHNRRIAA